jgi:hypothetical protein
MYSRVMLAAAIVAGLGFGAAQAAPVCSTTIDLGPSGAGVVLWSSLSSGTCIKTADKIYGTFTSVNLPSDTVLVFNLNNVGSLEHQQLSFAASYNAGTTYNWGYEVMVNSAVAVPGTIITSLDADFTQTASNGTSILDKSVSPTGDANIHEEKIGAIVQPGSVLMTNFGPGVTDLVINETLTDNGTISAVTNTVTEFIPGRNIPEPASLFMVAAALGGFGFARRKKA